MVLRRCFSWFLAVDELFTCVTRMGQDRQWRSLCGRCERVNVGQGESTDAELVWNARRRTRTLLVVKDSKRGRSLDAWMSRSSEERIELHEKRLLPQRKQCYTHQFYCLYGNQIVRFGINHNSPRHGINIQHCCLLCGGSWSRGVLPDSYHTSALS